MTENQVLAADVPKLVEEFLEKQKPPVHMVMKKRFSDGCTYMLGSEEVFIEEVGNTLYVRCYTAEIGDEYILKPLSTYIAETTQAAPQVKPNKGIAI